MKEQQTKKRPSTLPHRTLARFQSVPTDAVMESLVNTIKQLFLNLKCYPQDLRQSAIFGVFLNHIFAVSLYIIGDCMVT